MRASTRNVVSSANCGRQRELTLVLLLSRSLKTAQFTIVPEYNRRYLMTCCYGQVALQLNEERPSIQDTSVNRYQILPVKYSLTCFSACLAFECRRQRKVAKGEIVPRIETTHIPTAIKVVIYFAITRDEDLPNERFTKTSSIVVLLCR